MRQDCNALTMAKFRRDPQKSWHASAGDQENGRCRQSMLPRTLRWLFQDRSSVWGRSQLSRATCVESGKSWRKRVWVEHTGDIRDAARRFWRPGESPDPMRFRM